MTRSSSEVDDASARGRPSRTVWGVAALVVALTLALPFVKTPGRSGAPERTIGASDDEHHAVTDPPSTMPRWEALNPSTTTGPSTRETNATSDSAVVVPPTTDAATAVPDRPPTSQPPLPAVEMSPPWFAVSAAPSRSPSASAPSDQAAGSWREPAEAATAACWAEGLRRGVFGGVGDSLARDTVFQLRALGKNNKAHGKTFPDIRFKNERTVYKQATAGDVADFVRDLQPGAVRNATLLASRGLWEALNLANPPSTTFDAVRAIVRQWRATATGPAGTLRQLIINVPHCPHALTAVHRLRCGGEGNLGLYRRAVACAAAQELRNMTPTADGGGDVRLALYDSCSVVRQDDPRRMTDPWHMSPRMLNRTVSYMLARFVCPRHAAAEGIDTSPSEATGWFVDAGLGGDEAGARRAAAAAIEARWDCAAFAANDTDEGIVASEATTNAPQSTATSVVSDQMEAASGLRRQAWWPKCNASSGVGAGQATAVDRALGYTFKPECACSLQDHMYASDACWPSITLANRRARHPFRAFAMAQVCNLKTRTQVSEKSCAPEAPSTLPESLATDQAALHELGVVGCVAPDAQHLCLHNLGATLLPSVEDRVTAHAMLVNVSGLTDADDVAAVCRCHLAGTMANATEGRRVAGSRWCRSYATVEPRVRQIYTTVGKRTLSGVLGNAQQSIRKPIGGGSVGDPIEREKRMRSEFMARWLRALASAPQTFGCEAPSLIYLQMCGWLTSLHDERAGLPLADAAAAQLVSVAYKQAYPRAAKKRGVSIPGFALW